MPARGVRKTLIVALNHEDDEWTNVLPDGWEPFVVKKERDIPNRGREASSYHWALWKLYPGLRVNDLVACVQGNPFPHCPNLFLRLEELNGEAFTPLGAILKSSQSGMPHHPGLPVGECYEKWLGWVPPTYIPFVMGAQFATTGRQVKMRPRGFYKEMFEAMCDHEDDLKAPWVMERLWMAMLGGAGGALA